MEDTLATMKDVPAAEAFLSTLNNCHPSISFTMELASDNKLPFVGMEVLKKGHKLETSVYKKPTNSCTGLLLHQQSHVDKRYKKSLVKTMINLAFHLSSTREAFTPECDRLESLINSTISYFVTFVMSGDPNVPAQTTRPGYYLGFIILGEKSRVAEGHKLPRGVRGHAPPRKFFEMNLC